MKASLLIGTITLCFLWCSYGYEPSLYEAERLQTAEKLLWWAPQGMQKDIEAKLIKHTNAVDNEREEFCIQYLLYQLQMIAKKEATTATTNIHTPWLVTKVIDDTTFTVNINGVEKTVNFHEMHTPVAKIDQYSTSL